MNAQRLAPELAARLRRLRALRMVPDRTLIRIVARDGFIRRAPEAADLAAAARAADPDRELAARLCAGCPVADECLELELRWVAERATGVFGGLTAADRRALYRAWAVERARSTGRTARRVEGGER